MKTVAERDDEPRRVARDQTSQARERRRRIVRRQQHTARREGRAFFQMQIGDREHASLGPVQCAGRIADEVAPQSEIVLSARPGESGDPATGFPLARE